MLFDGEDEGGDTETTERRQKGDEDDGDLLWFKSERIKCAAPSPDARNLWTGSATAQRDKQAGRDELGGARWPRMMLPDDAEQVDHQCGTRQEEEGSVGMNNNGGGLAVGVCRSGWARKFCD